MNTFHLMQKPGSSTIQALGGLHRMSGWNRPIVTDSGGFQAYSLIHQNPKFGHLDEHGLTFQPEGSERKFQLSPEKSVQLQLGYGADVVICLDDCTHVDAPRADQERSVERTVAWGRRCKDEFERLVAQKRLKDEQRPRLFGVIQGGGERDLRKQCAEALLPMGFDGFGYGGWPLDGEGGLLTEIVAYTRELVPAHYPMHALGVGHPQNVLACYELGYGMFDFGHAHPRRAPRAAVRLRPLRGGSGRRLEGQLAGLRLHQRRAPRQGQPAGLGRLRLPDLPALFAGLPAPPVQDGRPPVLPPGDHPQPALYGAVVRAHAPPPGRPAGWRRLIAWKSWSARR